MLSSAANAIATCAFGLGLGAILTLTAMLRPRELDERVRLRSETEGRVRGAAIRGDDLSYLLRSPEAHAWRITMIALAGLIVVLVLTLWLSPVDFVGWLLIVSMIAASALMQILFNRARAQQLRVDRPSRLDPLGDIDRSADPSPTTSTYSDRPTTV
jgi:hypothetical protein